MNPKKALTIAGSDCSGGAGLQADLKTFQERDVYGMTVVTVTVAMVPDTWAHIVKPLSVETIKEQFATIIPGIGADAIKTGMLPTVEIIDAVGALLAKSNCPHIVIDPVMVCKGTSEPLFPENTEAMKRSLLPIAEVVTPNTFEAAQLAGMDDIKSKDDILAAAEAIHKLGPKYVLIKAARIFADKAMDVLYDGKQFTIKENPRINTTWTHGAGCSFSACVTAELAKGASVEEAAATATAFVNAGLRESFPYNKFTGPIYHKAYAKGL